jgi:putative Mg2+ transporter-C (MgtC) family protein
MGVLHFTNLLATFSYERTMEVWAEVWQTLKSEFSDIPDVSQLTTIVLRLTIAAVLGGILGFEREQQGKAAGVRTHMLVALGSALFVFVPQQMGVSDADLTRVLQGLVAGIGFLGAGSIIKGNGEGQIQGLTTAASVWLTAAIGMAAGMGRESTALLSTLLAFVILTLMPKFVGLFEHQQSLILKDYEKPREDSKP